MINGELIQAYNKTTYKVFNTEISIKVGECTPELDSLCKKHNQISWAFITAYNPYSKKFSEEENIQSHWKLCQATKNYLCFEGEGVGEDSSWTPELSLLIIGISKENAIRIGKDFKQNAIIFGVIGLPAELIIL
jgi:hypothetical protein